MKIYAIYDLMIGYFLNPFVAPDDCQVLASISQDISRPDNVNAIAYAPHQFQVWQLGEIDDEGYITARKYLICDCGTLIRARRETAESANTKTTGTHSDRNKTPNGVGGNTMSAGTAVPENA